MNDMKRGIFPIAISLGIMMGVLNLSCGNREVLLSPPVGGVAINATWPDVDSPEDSINTVSTGFYKPADAPAGVSIIHVSVTGPDFQEMSWDLNPSTGSSRLDGIPSGSGRSIYLSARDNQQVEIYWYRQDNIVIDPGGVTNVYASFLMTVPQAPSNIYVDWSNPPGSITITWNDNSDNEEYFVIERKKTTDNDFANLDSVITDIPKYNDYDFAAGDEFYYRVRARNSGGSSGYTNDYFFSTRTGLTSPSNAQAYWFSGHEIAIEWTDNSSDETQFSIEKRTSSGNWYPLVSVPGDSSIYIDSNYSLGENYYYRVQAINSYSSSDYSNEAYFYTMSLPPDKPVIHYGLFNGNNLKILWNQSTTADGYIIYRSDSGATGYYDSVGIAYSPDTAFFDYGTNYDDWYFYQVKAKGTYGFSDRSDIDSVYADHTGPLYFRSIINVPSENLNRVAMKNGNLYAINGINLLILDLTNPVHPALASSFNPINDVLYDIAVNNTHAFIAAGDSGLICISISDPHNPYYVSRMPLQGFAQSVTISDTVAFVGTGGNGMHAVNIRVPTALSYFSNYLNNQFINDMSLDVVGDSLHIIAASASDLVAINVANPNDMYYKNSYTVSYPLKGLFVDNNKAYLAATTGGLQIVDYSNIWAMSYAGSYGTTGAKATWYYQNYVMLADGYYGMKLLNVSANPTLADNFYQNDDFTDVVYNANAHCIYAAAAGAGIYVLEFSP